MYVYYHDRQGEKSIYTYVRYMMHTVFGSNEDILAAAVRRTTTMKMMMMMTMTIAPFFFSHPRKYKRGTPFLPLGLVSRGSSFGDARQPLPGQTCVHVGAHVT